MIFQDRTINTENITLLLLPGFDGTGNLFAAFQASLGDGYPVVVVRYGNEHTLNDYVETVASLLPVNNAVLIAESFSGPVALEVTRRFPSKINRVVLCATFATTPYRILVKLSKLVPEYLFGLKPLQRFLIRQFCLEAGYESTKMEEIFQQIHAVQVGIIKTRLKVLANIDMHPHLPQIAVPVLYLQAMQDKIVGASLSKALINTLPNVSVQRIDGPHLLLQTRPDECAEIIRQFIVHSEIKSS